MIHSLKHLLALDDDTYRLMLKNRYNVSTSKHLSYNQASDFIEELISIAKEHNLWQFKDSVNKKYENLKRDNRAATPKQLRKIEAMWAEVSYMPNASSRAEALNAFIKRIAGVDHILFLEKRDVIKVVTAIKAMKQQSAIRRSNEEQV